MWEGCGRGVPVVVGWLMGAGVGEFFLFLFFGGVLD